jgi:hypothetical protein
MLGWPSPDLSLSLPPAPGPQGMPPPPAVPAVPRKRPRSKAFSVIEAVEGTQEEGDETQGEQDEMLPASR